MTLLIEAARARGLRVMEGQVLAENNAMLSLVKRFGFNVKRSPDNPGVYDVARGL